MVKFQIDDLKYKNAVLKGKIKSFAVSCQMYNQNLSMLVLLLAVTND
jgi:hypothetical protein